MAQRQLQPSERSQSGSETGSALAGRRVVVTRAEAQGEALAALLRAEGAEPIAFPCIAIAPPDDPAPLAEALARLEAGAFDWLVLTSANAVHALIEAKGEGEKAKAGASAVSSSPVRPSPVALRLSPSPIRLAAVGPATAAAARELLALEPAVVPEAFVAEALAEALGDLRGRRVLLLNSAIARPILAKLLAEAGAHVERVVAYRTVTASGGCDLPALLAAGAVDAITFTSGSTVRGFAERVGEAGLELARHTTIACIGPLTAQAARDQGLPPTVVAASSTAEGLVASLAVALGERAP
jgi:uroporphyrinogen-III synthase